MKESGHGSVGTREQQFTKLLPLRTEIYPVDLLMDLAAAMKSQPDGVHDGPDPEENLWVPAGYTYFGQFVDHDLTFDNTSSLNPADMNPVDDQVTSRMPTNLRTPRFDLDSLYGDGPDAMPYLYKSDGASLLFKNGDTDQTGLAGLNTDQAAQDLLRSPNGRAIIGDKRNDENVLVGQIQLLFVRYHNAVVQALHDADDALTGTDLFEKARDEVRWTYQTLVLEDFLPRIVREEVWQDLSAAASPDDRGAMYVLYTDDKRENLPREFVVAAYRYGHSGVRQGYRVNRETSLDIFAGSEDPANTPTLLGFKPLPAALAIDDFGRFFPADGPGLPVGQPPRVAGADDPVPDPRLQYAYKLDTNIVDPLGALPLNILPTSDTKGGILEEISETISPAELPPTVPVPPVSPTPPTRPSLALLNLLRGNIYGVQGGQEIACAIQAKGLTGAVPLSPQQLVVRQFTEKKKDETGEVVNFYKFVPIAPELQEDTPLWFYILAEAQAPIVADPQFGVNQEFSETLLLNGVGARTQLGWVAGRIISEVFYGLLDSDPESVVNAAPAGWQPMLGGDGTPIFMNLVKFVG